MADDSYALVDEFFVSYVGVFVEEASVVVVLCGEEECGGPEKDDEDANDGDEICSSAWYEAEEAVSVS